MKSKWIVGGLGLLLALPAIRLRAQQVRPLNEVVISATKNDQKQLQTGKAVTIIDSAQLSRSSGRTLAELLNQQVGIQILGAGSNLGRNKSIFFRGAASAYTVVLIDGILAYDPSSEGTPFDLKLLAIDQIEKIEILRGGQSTIYGSDAVAGVINIITKKKAQTGNHIYGVGSLGSYNTYKGTIGINSKIDAFSYNISYSHLKTRGISDAEEPITASIPFDRDGMQQDAVNADFSLQLDKQLTVNPFLRYSHVSFDFDDDAFIDAANTSLSKNFNGGLNAVYRMEKHKLVLNYSHQITNRAYQDAFPRKYQGKMDLVDLYYNHQISDNLDLLLGIDNRATLVGYYESSGTIRPSTNLFSAYGSMFLRNLSLFNLEIGGRYNKHNKYGSNYTYNITPSILLARQLKLFGTISSAFRAPSLDMLFGPWGANINLKPEKSQNYEAGFDIGFFKDKLKWRATAFQRNIKDAIVYDRANVYHNFDLQRDKGLEVELGLTVNKINLNAYYTYVEGKRTKENEVSDILLRRPKHIYAINAGFKPFDKFFVSANYKFAGERIDTFFSPVTYAQENRTLHAYGLLDVYAEYQMLGTQLKIFADLKNITNEKYTEIIGYNTLGFNINAGVSFSF